MTNTEAVRKLKEIHDLCKDVDCPSCPFYYLEGGACNNICESSEKSFNVCLQHAKQLDEKKMERGIKNEIVQRN